MRLVLLGSPGEIKEIKFSIEYKVKGSNATFYKDKIFEVVIGNTPITLEVESPSSIISGDSFETVVSITLNSPEVLKGVVLKAEYPYGYSISNATPEPIADDNIWSLGDLSPGSKKTITIRGRLVGENEEERTFRFYVGVSDGNGADTNLKFVLVSNLNTVAIDRPYVGLNIAFNGENVPTYIAPAGRSISTSIRFQNNLTDKLINPRLEVSFSGGALDKFSVTAGNGGFYDSGNSKVVWNLVNLSGVQELNPGEGGQVTFRFSSLPNLSPSEGTHDITLNFSLTGVPVGAVGQKPVTVRETRMVKIASQVSFSSKMLRSSGPFVNFGPIPPKAEEETTYTAVFSVGNTQNDMTEAKVTARLGPGVSWLGASSVSNEDISYDSSSGIITWNLGTLSSGSGFSSAARELAFQVSLTPSVSQIGTVPVLINSIVFSGLDTLTGNVTTVSNAPLTTRLSSDPAFIQGDDIVTKK